jgi:hypothetical protein
MRRRLVTLVWHRQERQAVLERRAAISAGTWRFDAMVVVCVGSMLNVESTAAAAAGTRTFTI